MCHFVVRTPQLEAEHGLQVLSLEHDIAFKSIAQVLRYREGCFLHYLVDARGENKAEIL
jgi:hypothetical protein